MWHSYLQGVDIMPTWFWAMLGALFGGLTASFLAVVGERVPRGETLGGRSHCICGVQIPAQYNLPVLGWVLCRGRARCCGARLPIRYVLGEASLMLVWGVVGALAPNIWWAVVPMALSAGVLLALSWKKVDGAPERSA